jgi:hypothetical protein
VRGGRSSEEKTAMTELGIQKKTGTQLILVVYDREPPAEPKQAEPLYVPKRLMENPWTIMHKTGHDFLDSGDFVNDVDFLFSHFDSFHQGNDDWSACMPVGLV